MAACKIGDIEYNTLSDAITAANSNDTITLLENINVTETEINIGNKNLTISLDGHTLNVQTFSGTGTISFSVNSSLTIGGKTLSVSQGSATAVFENGSLTTITGSENADIITGNFNHVTILGGKGDDTIENGGTSSVSIDGGEGNNVINLTENYDSDATETAINVSQGNDTINVGSNVQKFSVTGFEVGDKLHFEAGSISAAEYDNNTLNVTLGENGKTVTISGDYKLSLAAGVATATSALGAAFELSDSTATYYTTRNSAYYSGSGTASITYHASVASNDSIVISGITDVSSLGVSDNNVSINVNAINDGGAGNDSITNSGISVSINGGEGNDTINLTGGTGATVNVSDGDDTINVGSNVTSFTVENFTAGDVITLQGGSVTSLNTSGDSLIAVADTQTVTIGGINTKYFAGNKWSLEGTTAAYAPTTIAGASIDDGKIIFTGTDSVGSALIELGGISSIDGMTPSDSVVALRTSNFTDAKNVSVKSNAGEYSFNITANGVTFNGSSGSDSIINSGSNVSINGGLGNDLITLSGGTNSTVNVNSGDDTINVGSAITEFTVIGFNTGDALNFASDVTAATYDSGTLNVTAGDKNINVKNATAPANRNETWLSFTGSAAIYGKTSGNDYLTNAKQITYPAADAETYFTLSGINDTAGVEVSVADEKVTVNASALNMNATSTYTVNLSGGNYTLDFKGTTTSNQVAETLTGSGGNYSYTSAYTQAYFSGSNKTYTFQPATTPTTFTISGLSTGVTLADNITVDNTTVKIFNSALAQKTVSLSTTDGYTLALGNDVTRSTSSSSSDWSGYRYGTTYSTSARYTISGNTISYTSGSSNFSTLFTLSGVTSTSGINVNRSAKTVTLTANNLGTNDITISGNNGYKLALASGIVQSKNRCS